MKRVKYRAANFRFASLCCKIDFALKLTWTFTKQPTKTKDKTIY